jgi:hypothetical protein
MCKAEGQLVFFYALANYFTNNLINDEKDNNGNACADARDDDRL